MSVPNPKTKEAKMLRKAAYWLTDYANCFRNQDSPGVEQFRNKLRKLAADCRKVANGQ